MENMSKITHRQYFIIILQLFIIYYSKILPKNLFFDNYLFHRACLENLHLSNPELSAIKTTISITLLCSKSVCKRRSIRWRVVVRTCYIVTRSHFYLLM